jgi:DNA-binding CsgD family transcriptional regulator
MVAGESRAGDLLDMLYSAAGDPSLWAQFLAELSRCMDAPWMGLIAIEPAAQTQRPDLTFGIPDDAARLYRDYYAAQDPWVRAYREQNLLGWAGTGSSLCPPLEFEKTEFYTDFVRLFDIYHVCGTVLPGDQGSDAALTALRRTAQPDFERQDVALLAELGPHVKRALLLHGRLLDLNRALSTVGQILGAVDVALVGLDADGKLRFANGLAESILRGQNGLLLENEKFTARNPRQAAHLDRLRKCAAQCGRGLPASSSMTVQNGERPLHLTFFPYRGGHDHFPASMRVFATITDPEAQPKSREQLLSTLFGLAPAEARIAMLLVGGMEPKEIAQHTRTTQNTVRFHLKVIYRKTGVSRQSQLVRLISSLPGQA